MRIDQLQAGRVAEQDSERAVDFEIVRGGGVGLEWVCVNVHRHAGSGCGLRDRDERRIGRRQVDDRLSACCVEVQETDLAGANAGTALQFGLEPRQLTGKFIGTGRTLGADCIIQYSLPHMRSTRPPEF